MTTTYDADAARHALEEERAKLVRQLGELGADAGGDLRSDLELGDGFSDAAAATAERTERLGLVESVKGMLDDVVAAIGRLDDGTYGICASCGKEIDAARLEFRPESLFCINCKSKRR
jgi:DnaK suppressor protein